MIRPCILLVALAGAADADVFTPETPPENIRCNVGRDIEGSDIFCTIIERDGPPALPRPAWCQTDWGHRFELRDRGPVAMACAPLDRDRSGEVTAPYGATQDLGGIVCRSETSGFECRNDDGHGFFLSRSLQVVF